MQEHQKGGWHSLSVFGRFEDLLASGPRIMVSHPARLWCPPTDVFECDNLFVIKLSVSGLQRTAAGEISNAQVTVEGDTVVIQGHREDESCFKKCGFHQMEIYYGPFECRVQIAAPFDATGIEAHYRDGFLEITVPKATAAASGPHQVKVRS